MYYNDRVLHHFHEKYGNAEVLIDIQNRVVLKGFSCKIAKISSCIITNYLGKGRINLDKILIENICEKYPIVDIVSYEKVKSGNTAETFLINSKSKKWILRKLKDRAQGDAEFAITSHLFNKGVDCVSPIIPTKDGKPYFCFGEDYYNLQEYINGIVPEVSDKQIVQEIAKSVAYMQNALFDSEIIITSKDRFDLLDLWEKGNTLWEHLYSYGKVVYSTREVDEILKELYLETAGNNKIIHGDLVIWNMIWTNNQIKIIDFGEARMGDYYFDIAGALCSSIGYNKSIEKMAELSRTFIDTYSQNFFKINISRLRSYIQLWYWRGILSVLNNEQFHINKKENVIKLSLDIMYKYNTILIS